MAKTGLVLEGGGQRGIYTAGVLDVFMDNDIEVDGVIGVSAGAIHGLSYVARQRGRNMRYNMKYRNNKHYMSLYSLLTTGDICGEQFCYHDIPEKLDPLDYDAFLANPTKLYVGCSNLDTGEAEYLECTDMRKPEDVNKVRASASLPLVSNIVEVDGMKLLDGGVSDSIPIFAFRRMGYRRNIVVLTRPEGYRKGPDKMLRLEAGRYRESLLSSLLSRRNFLTCCNFSFASYTPSSYMASIISGFFSSLDISIVSLGLIINVSPSFSSSSSLSRVLL